jgi:hypothetical protein
MKEDKEIEKYLNTLIYLIIVKAVAILSLLFLLFKIGEDFSYVIVTYQLGLLFIIFYVVWKITSYSKARDELREAMKKAPVVLDTCPNYFVRSVDDKDNTICHQIYTTSDGKYEYTFDTPSTQPINITELQDSSKDMEALCNNSSKYESYPWIEFKAKCNKL